MRTPEDSYRVESEDVLILHIIAAARDIEPLM
jgi:hypothetical protein